MKDGNAQWEALNAYVDGELPATEAARVAHEIACDRELASRTALLASLKATVGECNEEPAPREVLGHRPRRGRRGLAWAAVLLVGIFLGGFLALRGGSPLAPLEAARAVHARWVLSGPEVAASDAAEMLRTNLSALGLRAHIPDLSSAGLRFADIRRLRMAGGEGLHVGYLGPHGCMLSLVLTPDARDFRDTLDLYESPGGRAYGWRSGASGYLLMADRMAPARLAVIAEILIKVTHERRPLDELMRVALARSREANPPCA